MEIWIFTRLDENNSILTPPFVVARGSDAASAGTNAATWNQKYGGATLSKGNQFTSTAPNWLRYLGDDLAGPVEGFLK